MFPTDTFTSNAMHGPERDTKIYNGKSNRDQLYVNYEMTWCKQFIFKLVKNDKKIVIAMNGNKNIVENYFHNTI